MTPNPVRSTRPVIARKGTLEYTAAGLVLLFFYMLWGDLCIQLMEYDVPNILPLQLRELGSSNTLIALIAGTIPALFGMTMNPFFSFRSDRLRTRWGRRRPFLFITTPLVALVLIALGFTPELSAALHELISPVWVAEHPHTLQIALITGLVMLFYFFNTALLPIYCYLVVDVVPDAYLGRFMALFRIMAYLSGFLFQRYIYGYALSHTRLIYCGTAAVFFCGFLLMAWRVRESDYPPPPAAKTQGIRSSLQTYFRECFSKKHYLAVHFRYACFIIAYGTPNYFTFAQFYYRDGLGISPTFIGSINGWVYLLSACALFPLGLLCDKMTPVRFMVATLMINLPLPLLAFFLIRDQTSYVVLTFMLGAGRALFDVGSMPLTAAIFPRERYGQFGSASQMVTSALAMGVSIALGGFLDWITHRGEIHANYRYIFLWVFFMNCVGLALILYVHRSWKRHGGPDNYVAP